MRASLPVVLFVALLSSACHRPAAPIHADPQKQGESQPVGSAAAARGPQTDAGLAASEPAEAPSSGASLPGAASAPDPSAAASATGPRDADDVREATFRYMFKKNASGQQQSARVYCIALENGADPPAAFLRRLRDVTPVVKAVSACDASAARGVVDKSSGASGLIFRAEGILWRDSEHAEVSGGYYEAGLSASGNTYFAERKRGKWVIVKDVMHWIS